MPDEVRAEIEPYFWNSDPIVDEDSRKLPKLDDNTADYVQRGLAVSVSLFEIIELFSYWLFFFSCNLFIYIPCFKISA